MVELVSLLFPAFGAVMLFAGAALVQKGRFYSRQSERVAETAVSDADSLQRGSVAVQGTATVDEDEGTVTTALTGEDALVSQSKVVAKEDRSGVGSDDDDTNRRMLHEAEQSVPFLVADDTGTVRVDPPEEADIRLDENRTIERGRGVPDAAELADDPDAAAAGEVSVGDSTKWREHRRRYEQAAIVPGEEVYVLGEAVDSVGWDGGDVEITGGEHPERFIVSDEGREAVQSGGKIGAYIAYVIGGGVGGVGTLILLVGLATML